MIEVRWFDAVLAVLFLTLGGLFGLLTYIGKRSIDRLDEHLRACADKHITLGRLDERLTALCERLDRVHQ